MKTKRFTTLLALIFVLATVLVAFTALTACTPRGEILRILNWHGFLCDGVVADFEVWFEESTGIPVTVQQTNKFSNNETFRDIAMFGRDFDIAVPSDYMVERMLQHELLLPMMSEADIRSNLLEGASFEYSRNNISPFILDNLDFLTEALTPAQRAAGLTGNDFFMPYMWGTMGILFDPDRLPTAIANDRVMHDGVMTPRMFTSWEGLFAPQDPAFNNSIYMKSSERDSFAIASIWANRAQIEAQVAVGMSRLEAVGNAMNMPTRLPGQSDSEYQTMITQFINRSVAVMHAQVPFRHRFEDEEARQHLADPTSGTPVMSLQWSGSAVFAARLGRACPDVPWGLAGMDVNAPNLMYSVPVEGSNLWINNMVIPRYARNQLAANMFMHFISQSENAIRNMDATGYTTAIYGEALLEWFADTANRAGNITRDVSWFFNMPEYTHVVSTCPIIFPNHAIIQRSAIMRDYGVHQSAVDTAWDRIREGRL